MKTLKLSDIRKPLPFKIQKGVWAGHLIDYKDYGHRYGYVLDFDVYLPSKNKNLQRDYCWNLQQKQELILSIIKEIDIRAISIIIWTDDTNKERKDKKVYKIIDGKQRLSTLIDFINDVFPVILEDEEYYYSDLTADIKNAVDLYNLHFDQTYEYIDDMISDDDKIAWFELINFAGTPQDIQHLKNLKS